MSLILSGVLCFGWCVREPQHCLSGRTVLGCGTENFYREPIHMRQSAAVATVDSVPNQMPHYADNIPLSTFYTYLCCRSFWWCSMQNSISYQTYGFAYYTLWAKLSRPNRYNDARDCEGAGIRLGGWEDSDGYQHGQNNDVSSDEFGEIICFNSTSSEDRHE